jgi:O-acetyl-ADP-ribose deacetylase (regulator of RNase III)
MPIINRIETDMFRFQDCVDYMVNPVNLEGISGKGLAHEFRMRCPDSIEVYRTMCRTKELRVGTVTTYDGAEQRWGIIYLPTKRSPYDLSSKEDIQRGLVALRNLLKTDKFKNAVIGLPMLGCGNGQNSYEIVYPMMIELLSDLDATIIISMNPERTEVRPKYLSIVGASDFGADENDRTIIDRVIASCMKKWGYALSDYTGILVHGSGPTEQYMEIYAQKEMVPVLKVSSNPVKHPAGHPMEADRTLSILGHDMIIFSPVDRDTKRGESVKLIRSSVDQRNDDDSPKQMAVYFRSVADSISRMSKEVPCEKT